MINHEYANNLVIRNNTPIGGVSWMPPTFVATTNVDFNPDGSVRGERHTTLTIIGPDGRDISAVNGGVVDVRQLAASWVDHWSIVYSVSGNPIPTTGGLATINCYAINKRTLAGITDQSFIQYAAPSVSSDNAVFAKSATSANGTNNWMLTISAGENQSTERSTNIVISHEGATETFRITQAAGVKVYSKPVITFRASKGTNSAFPLSSAANELSNLTYQVSVSYQWNGIGAVYNETYYPTISGSAIGFNRNIISDGSSMVLTEKNYGDQRSITYTATFEIGGQTADPVSVTIYQARAWNVET